MDILAARKKAAELAKAREKTEQEPVQSEEPAVAAQPAPQTGEPSPPALPEVIEQRPVSEVPITVEPPEAVAPADADSADQEPQAQEIELLSFRLGEEEYAVMVDDVKEVLKNRDLTPVPNSPDYILGVTSLRGTILPVIDLCKRLGISPGARDEKSRILVVNLNEEYACIIVDRVTGVVRISPDAVRPAPETIERGAEFLRGIARKDDRLYILLDIERAMGA